MNQNEVCAKLTQHVAAKTCLGTHGCEVIYCFWKVWTRITAVWRASNPPVNIFTIQEVRVTASNLYILKRAQMFLWTGSSSQFNLRWTIEQILLLRIIKIGSALPFLTTHPRYTSPGLSTCPNMWVSSYLGCIAVHVTLVGLLNDTTKKKKPWCLISWDKNTDETASRHLTVCLDTGKTRRWVNHLSFYVAVMFHKIQSSIHLSAAGNKRNILWNARNTGNGLTAWGNMLKKGGRTYLVVFGIHWWHNSPLPLCTALTSTSNIYISSKKLSRTQVFYKIK